MITNNGKGILAKYLIGQAPAYASYIAIGCGPKPLALDDTLADYSLKTELDFEMFRVPITSRGYVTEGGQSKIVFTAELPTEERYEITEIGVYSAGSNPAAGAQDSRTIFAFDDSKVWTIGSAQTEIPVIYTPLDAGDLGTDDEANNEITITHQIFKTNADNRIFTDSDRIARYERSRFLNSVLVMRGDNSDMSVVDGHLDVVSGSHIILTGESINFTKNAPTDELRLAFSIINKSADSSYVPDKVRILIEFSSSSTLGSGEWARFELIMDDYDFTTNRYIVATKQLQELYKSSTGFSWNSVDTVKIYASVLDDDTPSSNFYVSLDAMRLENKNNTSPLYALTGYSIIKNTDSKTIVKNANKTSYVEFRFGMDVL